MSKTGKGIKKMTEDLKQTSRKSMIIVEAKVASEEFYFAWPRSLKFATSIFKYTQSSGKAEKLNGIEMEKSSESIFQVKESLFVLSKGEESVKMA